MDDVIVIKLADFSKFPSGRDETDGAHNGERFRNEVLKPAIEKASREGKYIEVSLEGVLNFGSSFFEEAFGGVIRCGILKKDQLERMLRITPEDSRYGKYRTVIIKHIRNA